MTNSENFTFKSFIVFTLMSRKDFIYKQEIYNQKFYNKIYFV